MADTNNRPNVLIMMSDQHNPHVLGCEGDPVVRTPNLDAIAARGVLFESAYCQSPLCVPSRMSFLTSQQPSEIKVWTNGCVLPYDVSTFAHSLGAAGYETTLIGRMHFVGHDQYHGFQQRLVGSLTAVHAGGRGPGLTPALLKGTGQTRPAVTTAGPGKTAYQAYDEAVAQAAAEFLAAKATQQDKPFCAVVGFVLPHCPFVCPKEDWDYYYDRVTLPEFPEGYFDRQHPAIKLWRKNRGVDDVPDEEIRRARAGYYGIVTHFDRQVGVVMDALGQAGLAEDTIVLYTSDHGEMAGEHGMWWKSNCYEGSASVPLIVSCPERFETGRRVKEVVSLVDIGPTLCELAGAEPMPLASGRSFLPLLQEEPVDWPNEAFSEHYATHHTPPVRMIRRDQWKLVHHEGHRPQLFDLEADPDEFHDLGNDPAHAATREELHQRVLADWSADEMASQLALRSRHQAVLRDWYRSVQPPNTGLWVAPPDANDFPDDP